MAATVSSRSVSRPGLSLYVPIHRRRAEMKQGGPGIGAGKKGEVKQLTLPTETPDPSNFSTRGQRSIDQVSLISEEGFQMDPGIDAAHVSNDRASLPVQDDAKETVEQVPRGGQRSNVLAAENNDTPTLDDNNDTSTMDEAKQAESCSATDISNNISHASLALHHLPSTLDYSSSTTKRNSHTAEDPSESMPPLQDKSRSGPHLRGKTPLAKRPRLPDWLAKVQANNPAKSVNVPEILVPYHIASTAQEAYLQGVVHSKAHEREAAKLSPQAERTRSWVNDGLWPFPEAGNSHKTPSDLGGGGAKQRIEPTTSVANRSHAWVGNPQMALRDQSTNFPPLPSAALSYDRKGQVTARKEQPTSLAPHLQIPEKEVKLVSQKQRNLIPPHLRAPQKKAEAVSPKPEEWTAPQLGEPKKRGDNEIKHQAGATPQSCPSINNPDATSAEESQTKPPHLHISATNLAPGTATLSERRQHPERDLEKTSKVDATQHVEQTPSNLRFSLKDPDAGLVQDHVKEEISGQVPSTEPIRHDVDQPPPRLSSSLTSSLPLVTNSSDFLSQAAITLNNLKQSLPGQAPSPDSTDTAAEVGEEKDPTPSPPEPDSSRTVQPPPITETRPCSPNMTSVPKDEDTTQQERQADDSTSHNVIESHRNPTSPTGSVEADASDASMRGEGNGNSLSSIPDSIFFEYAYNGHDASVPSEIVFQGRKPKNPYKDLREGPLPVPGWEGAAVPVYVPGQLMGWDGNWQEAPVEWDRRDLYDYKAPEHQQNVRNFIQDRYEAYKGGLCPAIKVEDDRLFMEGHALAMGVQHFGKPIPRSEHHHLPPDDPFSLGKLTRTAEIAIANYVRVNAQRLQEQANRERAAAERKSTKAQRIAEYQAREAALAEEARKAPPNPFLPRINIYIRPAQEKDLSQIRDIHNLHIRISTTTGELTELSEREWRSRFDDAESDKFPFLVAILKHHGKMDRGQGKKEKVVGFTYAEDFAGEHTLWRHTCEVQIHVHQQYLHQGVGKNLMDCLLRGINPTYQARNAVEFAFTPGENDRYEGGGERIFSNIIFALPYAADEEERCQWIAQWLIDSFHFECQAILKGVGRRKYHSKRINLAYYVMETFAQVD